VQGDGLPRLTVSPACVNVVNEFESYVWKKASGTGIVKDEPEKTNDHAMDAIRYLDKLLGEYSPAPQKQPKQDKKYQRDEGGWARRY
jgi:phage terminase large subunit